MITGVEAAGLVLAILPLLISGLDHYREGLIPIKDWLRYRSEVKCLIRNLNVEQVRFRIICEKLLSGIVPEEELADLLEWTSLARRTYRGKAQGKTSGVVHCLLGHNCGY